MFTQCLGSDIKNIVLLAEAKAREVPNAVVLVEGTHGYRGDTGLADDLLAKGHVVALETDGADIDRQEIGALGLHGFEADGLKRALDAVAFRLLLGAEPGEVGLFLL